MDNTNEILIQPVESQKRETEQIENLELTTNENSNDSYNNESTFGTIIEKSRTIFEKALQITSDNIGKPFIEFSQKINSNFVNLLGL